MLPSINVTREQAHVWTNVAGDRFIADTRAGLEYFASVDDCVNWLWLNGAKDAAREVNRQAKL